MTDHPQPGATRTSIAKVNCTALAPHVCRLWIYHLVSIPVVLEAISMRLYLSKPVQTCNDDDQTHNTERSTPANMRATPIDRAISSHSNLMLLSFTGIVIAAFSFVALFGKLPTIAAPLDKAVLDEDEEVDELNGEEQNSKGNKPHKGKGKETGSQA
ncbi:hypothetical protein V1508DRAFT_460798 [Lipomyces doorenjongii]|uniref:uncharacterized protein n=1 Tax=Lipomyces doorenjongii TaxID=383834 RepID=UPI0034CF8FBE